MKRLFPKIAVAATILALVLIAGAEALTKSGPTWTNAVTAWHYDANGPNDTQVLIRQLGTSTDTTDDTVPVTFTPLGATASLTTHSSPWADLNLGDYGVPADAKVVLLTIKTLITKPSTPGGTVVYVFMRAANSTCCEGPSNSPTTPVDFSTSTNPEHLGEVAQTVLSTEPDGVRGYTQVTIPVVNGEIEWAWGYRKQGDDALAFDVYLDGYGT